MSAARTPQVARFVAAGAVVFWLCTLAGGSPATRPAGPIPPDVDSLRISWQSDHENRDPVVRQTELDKVGSLAVGDRRIVVGGHHDTAPYSPGRWQKGEGRLFGISKDSGKILWSLTHDALPERVHDMAANISSTPFIEGDRIYYISNRGELGCVSWVDGQVFWMLDMPAKLGVFKCDPGDAGDLAPSPIVIGNIVYCVTANGGVGRQAPAPDAPSFLAVDKFTGKVIWSSNAPGKRITYGQWSTPALATVDGAAEILFPGGDGALYAFEPITGKQLWRVDCRQPETHARLIPEFITAPPLVVGETAFVSPAIDIEFSGDLRRLLAVDLRTHAIRWAASPAGFSGTLGPMAHGNGTLYAASRIGVVAAVDANNGTVRWTRDLEQGIGGGISLLGEKLYLITEDGNLLILSSGTGQTLDACELADAGIGTPIVRDHCVYVITRHHAWSLRLPGE